MHLLLSKANYINLCVWSFFKKGEGAAPKKDPVSTLQYLLGPLPKLIVSGHLLGVQLMSVNAYLHTSITYGQWEGWDGDPLDEPPLFYNGLTESAANLLSSVSDEVVNIAKVFAEKTGADMSNVRYSSFFVDLIFTSIFSWGLLTWTHHRQRCVHGIRYLRASQ